MSATTRASLLGSVGPIDGAGLTVLDMSLFGLAERVRAARVNGVGTVTGSGRADAP